MRLSNVCDEDLKKIAMMKTKKGTATSEARRAQQILYSRNKTLGGFNPSFRSTLEVNPERNYKSFSEENGGITL